MFLYFVFMLVTAVYADEPTTEIHPGACPVVTPATGFDWAVGQWYGIALSPGNFVTGGQCAGASFTIDGDSMLLKITQVVNRVQINLEATADYDPAINDETVLIFTFVGGGVTFPLHIKTDGGTHYAIAYGCVYDASTDTHVENVWILSRTWTLEGQALKSVNKYFWRHGCEIHTYRDDLIDTVFSDEACAYNSSIPMFS